MSLANQKYVCILKEIINAGDLVTTRNHEVYSSFNLPTVTVAAEVYKYLNYYVNK